MPAPLKLNRIITPDGIFGAKMTIFESVGARNPRRGTVLIFPGGGYCWLSDRESMPIAEAFCAAGYCAAILSYEVSADTLGLIPVKQAAWAVGKLRETYPSESVYLAGFSAGAHCAMCLGVHWNDADWNGDRFLDEVRAYLLERCTDETRRPILQEAELFRPDRMILSYPVISGGAYAHRGSFQRLLGSKVDAEERQRALRWFSLETQVSKGTPPTFLWHTAEDTEVPVQNSLFFAERLVMCGVPVELHIYPKGEHGLSLATDAVQQPEKGRLSDAHVAQWFPTMLEWLDDSM